MNDLYNGMNDLFNAVSFNEKENYYKLINNININVLDKTKWNLLFYAITQNRKLNDNTIALDLIKRGINLEQADKKKMTPIHFAVYCNNLEVAHAILAAGGNVNAKDFHDNTPLIKAVIDGIKTTATQKNIDMIKLLLEYGADPNSKSKSETSALNLILSRNIKNDPQIDYIIALLKKEDVSKMPPPFQIDK